LSRDISETPVEVTFDFFGLGGADICIRLGAETVVLGGVCYGTDALGDLLRVALMIAAGARSAECSFDLEPHELRLAARRQDINSDVIDLTVHERSQWPLPQTRQLASAQCRAEDLASAIESAATTILETKGQDGYREIWGWAFPTRALAALRAALELPPPQVASGPTFPHSEPIAIYQILGSDEAAEE
jgi:hypothetical protein